MSGSPDKAKLTARQYGIADEAVYGYGDWERLRQNQEVRRSTS